MSSTKSGSFAEKHDPDANVDPVLAKEIRKQSKNASLPCAVAFKLAGDLRTTPQKVGTTADLLEISLSKCQLGLFGYSPNKKIVTVENTTDQDHMDAITDALINGRLPCQAAWKIAARFKISKLKVGNICETLSIKITPCQLGAF